MTDREVLAEALAYYQNDWIKDRQLLGPILVAARERLAQLPADDPQGQTFTPDSIPEILRPLVPSIGSVWLWEPDKAHARERAIVTAVKWNGEEIWIESADFDGKRSWNDFSRWIQAAVFEGWAAGGPLKSTSLG